jgi:hypothetical protein
VETRKDATGAGDGGSEECSVGYVVVRSKLGARLALPVVDMKDGAGIIIGSEEQPKGGGTRRLRQGNV